MNPSSPRRYAAVLGGSLKTKEVSGHRFQTYGRIFGWSCAEPEVGFDGPCGSLSTQNILWPPLFLHSWKRQHRAEIQAGAGGGVKLKDQGCVASSAALGHNLAWRDWSDWLMELDVLC